MNDDPITSPPAPAKTFEQECRERVQGQHQAYVDRVARIYRATGRTAQAAVLERIWREYLGTV